MMRDPVVQVWTAPKSAGGAPLGPLPVLLNDGRLTIAQSVRGAQGVSGVTTKALAEDAGLSDGAWIRIVDPITGVSEWLVSSVTDADGQGRDRVEFQAVPLRQVLTARGRIRTIPTVGSPVTVFTPGPRTVDALMELYYTPNLAEDDLSWFAYDASEYSGTIDIGTLNGWTRAQLLDAIERATGYEWDVQNDTDSGYTLTLVRQIGASAETQRLSPGVELDRLERVRDLMTAATVVDPVTSNGVAIGETCWRVRQISGTGPWWVALEDPAGGPAVIREDGQLVDRWLVPRDGAPVQILDARASDSAVQLASIAGVVVGSLITLWETADGRLISSLTSPSGLGSTRRRIVRVVQGASPYTSRNVAPDPLMREGLAGWEYFDPATVYDEQTQSFSRDDPVRTTGYAAGGESSGVTAIDIDGLPPGFAIRNGEVIQVEGVRYTSNALTVVPANGQVTVPIVGTLSATILGDVSLGRRIGSGAATAVRTNGTNSSGASSLTLKDLPGSTALAASDQLQTIVGGEGQVLVSAIEPVAGPAHQLTITPLPFDIASSVVLRVTENQFALGEYYGGVQISAYAGTAPALTATVTPIPVDIPDGTTLVISELRRQVVGTRTQTVTYTVTLQGAYTANATTMALFVPARPPEGVFVFVSAAASYQSARRTRAVTYDITLTSSYTAGGTTLTGTGTRPLAGDWFFDSASARYNGTTLRTYTITGTPALWSTAALSTATITGTLAETLAAGTAMRWLRAGVLLGDLVINATASGGGNTIQLQGGAFVKYVQSGETFELPSFTTYTTAASSADGAGVAVLTVSATPAAIADNVAITIVRCPDYARSEPGGPNVVRLRGGNGTGTTATSFTGAQYRQAGVFAYYQPPARIIVPAGQTVTLRARLAYTLWATAASTTANCRLVLYNVNSTSAAILAEVSIDPGSSLTIPYTADLQTVTHGEISLSVDLTASTRIALGIYALSTTAPSFLFGRSIAIWTGDADVPAMDGADNNNLWHKAQDLLEGGANTARYRAALSPTYQRVADDPLTLGALVRIPSPWLGLDVTARLLRITQAYPRTTAGPAIELDVRRPLLSESSSG